MPRILTLFLLFSVCSFSAASKSNITDLYGNVTNGILRPESASERRTSELPTAGTGIEYASACNAASRSWINDRGEARESGVPYTSTWINYDYSVTILTNILTFAINTVPYTLCDGYPRIDGHTSASTFYSKVATVPDLQIKYGTSYPTKPAPSCTIRDEDCAALHSSYSPAWSSWRDYLIAVGQWTSVPSTFVTPRLPSTTPTWPGMVPVCETRASASHGIAVTSIRGPSAGQPTRQSGPVTAPSLSTPQTTPKVEAGAPAQRIKGETAEESSVDPLTYNSVVVGAPVCAVTAASVKLLYWPVSTASENDCQNTVSTMTMGPTITGKPNTFVLRNTTLTSPTVYMEFDETWAYQNNGTMITSESRLLLPHNSTDVSSLCGRTDAWGSLTLPVNYADFNHPVPASAYRCQQKCFREFTSAIYSTSYVTYQNASFPRSSILSFHSTWATENLCSTIWDDFAPQLAIPAAFSTIAPVMEVGNGISCTFTFNSDAMIYDPPSALTRASSLVMPSAPGVTTTSSTLLRSVPATKAPEPSSMPKPSVPTVTAQSTLLVRAHSPGGDASAEQDSDPSFESQATMSELPTESFDKTPSAERTMAPLVESSGEEPKTTSRPTTHGQDATHSASDETGSRLVGDSLVSGMDDTTLLASSTSADASLAISKSSDGTDDTALSSFSLSQPGPGANIAGIIASVLGATQAQNGYSDTVEALQSSQDPAAAISSTTNLAPTNSQPSQSRVEEPVITYSSLDEYAGSSPEKSPTSTSTLIQSTSGLRSAFPGVSTSSDDGSVFTIKESSGVTLETGVAPDPETYTKTVSSKTVPFELSRSLSSSNGASQTAYGTQAGPYAVIPLDGKVPTKISAPTSNWQSEMTLRPGEAVTISGSTISFPQSASFVIVNGVPHSIATMLTPSAHGRERNATTTETRKQSTSSVETREYTSSSAYKSDSPGDASSTPPTASVDSTATQSLPVVNTAIFTLLLAMMLLL
ncbi:hypothetical protein KC316_g8090 [Hortaea werneckii]|nr:hypothetical protein KC324_g10035 [Hortaea werneckii]KAI7582056.1 hypothetical protein KC316_g8090 [Hortaea werneckii]